MSTAPQLAVGTTLDIKDDVNYSAFQGINAFPATELVCGNIFLGLQGYFAVRVPLGEQLGLCRGGTIETGLTNAAVTMVATRNWTAGGSIEVNCMLDDSPRAGPLDPRLAWKPPSGFGPDWRRDTWGTFDTRLEDTGGSPFLDTPAFNNPNWGLRYTELGEDQREELAQKFTVTGGPWSVARAILEMRRFGSPSGSVEVAIQADSTDAYGRSQPSGTDLGVSASVLCSTVTATPGNGPVTFAFSPDVVLADGDYWVVLRAVPTAYAFSATNFLVWLHNRNFLNVGSSHYTPNGVGFDRGNYPGHVDIQLDTQAKIVGTAVIWSPPATSIGQTRSTPNLSSLVQEVILNSGHETASALCFTFRTVGETRTFGFRAHGHPSGSPPGFACQFRRRDSRGGVL